MDFYTLHDFYFFTKGVTYLIMGGALVVMIGVWHFLTERDEDPYAETNEPHAE